MDPTPASLYDFIFSHDSTASDVSWYIDALDGTTRTASDVRSRVDLLAAALQSEYGLGVSSPASRSPLGYLNEVVALVCPNDIDFTTVVWAVHKLGGAIAPSNAAGTAEELAHQFRLTSPTLLVAHSTTLERVRDAAQIAGISQDRIVVLHRTDRRGESAVELSHYTTIENLIELKKTTVEISQVKEPAVAFVCFSSGTTGLPKAVAISHSAVISNTLQVEASAIPASRSTPGDRALGVVPFTHMYGLLHLGHLCPHIGIATVVFPSLPPFGKFLDLVDQWQINHLFLAPPLVNAFLKHPAAQGRSFAYFKSGMVAAAPLAIESEEAFRKLGGPDFLFSQAFGMTETAGATHGLPTGAAPRPGSVGCAVSGMQIKIVRPDGSRVEPGAAGRGEMHVRGPQLFLGYLDNAAATQDAFDAEGYLRTGDEVQVSADGFVTVMDRLKHIIKCKGFQVSPAELEGHLLTSSLVEDAGVVSKQDDRSGEVPVAFVVPTAAGHRLIADSSLEQFKSEVKKHVSDHKSSYKWLADVYVIERIPKLPSGKILFRELRKLVESPEVSVPSPVVPRTDSESIRTRASTPSSDNGTLSSTSDVEKAAIQGHVKATLLQEQAKLAREKRADAPRTRFERLREWISYYRLFHFTLLSTNLIGIGFTLAHKWPVGREFSATFASCNILAALLARNEVFVRLVFQFFMLFFKRWPPLFVRNAIATLLLNIGGLHSGFAVSGTLWLIAATVEFFRSGPSLIHPAILALSVVASVVLVLVCGSAYPTLRNTHHNVFENTHRLAGWSGLAVLWILVGLADSWSEEKQQFLHTELFHKPDVYLIIVLTALTALPWTTLRKVPVQTRVLSKAVCQITFPNGGRFGVGYFGRVSRQPMKENHAFGITTIAGTNDYCMFVVGQGDFTRDLIENPPTHLYTRMYKFVGLPFIAPTYRRGLYVVTGSAIGVALSVFLHPDPRSEWHLLWVAANIEGTYNDTAVRFLKEAMGDEFATKVTIWDSRVKGRPDLNRLIVDRALEMDAEVVFVTSNPKGTADVMRACRASGISAHGPVWDS